MKHLILILCCFSLGASAQQMDFGPQIEPCHVYQEKVQLDDTLITSYQQAKNIALDFFRQMGFEFSEEELKVSVAGHEWKVRLTHEATRRVELCVLGDDMGKCVGQDIIIRRVGKRKYKILMEYQNPC